MDQRARPKADIANTGWVPTPSSPADLFSHLNEEVPDDTSYVSDTGCSNSFAVQIDPLGIPIPGTQFLTVRARSTVAGGLIRVQLLQGSLEIASQTFTPLTTSFADYVLTLTAKQVDLITDYQNLSVRVSDADCSSSSSSSASRSSSASPSASAKSSSSSGDPCAGWYCCQETGAVVYFSNCAEKNAYLCGSSASSKASSKSSPASNASSSSSATAKGGVATCCSRALNTTLTAALSGGNGNIGLVWDGTYWSGSKALACGLTLYLRFTTACELQYSCNGSAWLFAVYFVDSGVCGPPMSGFEFGTINMNTGTAGCTLADCGNLTAKVGE